MTAALVDSLDFIERTGQRGRMVVRALHSKTTISGKGTAGLFTWWLILQLSSRAVIDYHRDRDKSATLQTKCAVSIELA